MSGTLSRLPDLKCIFCHAGGGLTPQIRRLVRAVDGSPKLKARVPNGAMARTVQALLRHRAVGEPGKSRRADERRSPTQILFGTDYPYFAPPVTIAPMDELDLDPDQATAIARTNALRLFPRLAA